MQEEPTAVEQEPEGEHWHPYEKLMAMLLARRRRAETGTIVTRAREQPWQQSRQGRSKYLLHPIALTETALQDWLVFEKEIPGEDEGRHVHQGGLVIYITQGKGYSILDGVRHDWKVGDLLILPIRPGGCDHQHFADTSDGTPARWTALIYIPYYHATGAMMTQVSDALGWEDMPKIRWDD